MELKTLGNSSIKVTPLAFGAWAIGGWLWGGSEEKDAIRAIRASYESGMTTIDTAPVYGFGKSEELVGEALVGIPRDRYQILTKFGMNWESHEGEYFFDTFDRNDKPVKMYRFSGRKKVKEECEESLRRLRTDYIDLYQIHWPDNTTPIAETMEAVAELIKEGKVRAAGVCNYSADQVEEALETVDVVSNQVPYSMVKRDIEKDVVPQAIKRGLGIIPYSPLQRGILSGKIKPGHVFNHGDTRSVEKEYQPENIARINALLGDIKPVAEEHGVSLSQLVINWTAQRKGVECVLVGARDEKQVAENVKSLSFKLSPQQLATIDKAVDAVELV
jgi:aryl-alcohol dehydrogenase-like predicted oxidoreductase